MFLVLFITLVHPLARNFVEAQSVSWSLFNKWRLRIVLNSGLIYPESGSIESVPGHTTHFSHDDREIVGMAISNVCQEIRTATKSGKTANSPFDA